MSTGSDLPLDPRVAIAVEHMEKPKTATIEDAVRLLEELGSNHDPIYFKGNETCASDLAAKIPDTKLKDIRIGYHTRGRRVENGTFFGMIKDRGGIEKAAENSKWPIHRATYVYYDR